MEIVLAKTAGFCPGVERAVKMVYEESEKRNDVFTFGPIVHNEEVVAELEKRGVKVIDSESELPQVKDKTLVIRAHGVSERIYKDCESLGIRMVDATCPFVKKIHNIVKKYSSEGRHILIIGNKDHPEVLGIMGWCAGGVDAVENEEQLEEFLSKYNCFENKSLCIVSQTTFNYTKFNYLVEKIHKKSYDVTNAEHLRGEAPYNCQSLNQGFDDVIVLNTICNATEERQREAYELARKMDAMLVIGGRHSSNTQKLFGICKKECENTFYIQTLKDIDPVKLGSFGSLGITAGASTPNYIIKEVYNQCQKLVSKNY